MTDLQKLVERLAKEVGFGWDASLGPVPGLARFAQLFAEECAKVCEAQAAEPECPERAQYCADAIRERFKA